MVGVVVVMLVYRTETAIVLLGCCGVAHSFYVAVDRGVATSNRHGVIGSADSQVAVVHNIVSI